MSFAPGALIAGRFRLERVLGQGGMGAVWLAQHTGLDVPCAVKFIHQAAAESPEIRARFEREAKAAAQLRSPHVVQILDHGVWEGSPYIAMELLEGEDLAQRLKARGTLSPPEVAGLVAQVGRALSKAHAAGLVHRDLKPANIYLVLDDDREIAKVLDFGVAKATALGNDGNTKTGAVLGTPYYMSPEQARGSREVDHRADLWALAVLSFQALTGHLPFNAEGFGDLLVKIIVDAPPVPSQWAPVPPGFDAWWARAVARDPADRFQSAKEMTEALSLALGVTMPGPATGEQSAFMRSPALGSLPGMSSSPNLSGTPMPGMPPTAMQQAISVAPVPAPARSRAPLVVGGAVAAGIALGLAAWLATGRTQPGPAAATSATTPPAAISAAKVVSASAAPPSSAAAPALSAAPPEASASAAPSASPRAAPQARPGAPKAAPKAKPAEAPAAPAKPDFGI